MTPKLQPSSGDKYSEADWNTVSDLQREPYWLSKVGGVVALLLRQRCRAAAA